MDDLLQQILVCPRDGSALTVVADALVCECEHQYPIFNGVPVMLLEDVHQTATWASESISRAKASAVSEEIPPIKFHGVDDYVQAMVAGTCGNLYLPILNKLTDYPIPDLPLSLGNGGLLLDVGCNWGRWCVAAARKGYRVIGIDSALDSVLAANRVCCQLGLQCIFVVADARYLPFRQKCFDVVFSYSVIQHFSKTDAKMALSSIGSVLKPTGISLVQMPNKFGIRCFYHLLRRGFTEGINFQVRYWSVGELKRAFSEAIGPTVAFVDGYFGLGIQRSDVHLLPWSYRLIVRISDFLRHWSKRFPFIIYAADSVYLKSTANSAASSRDI